MKRLLDLKPPDPSPSYVAAYVDAEAAECGLRPASCPKCRSKVWIILERPIDVAHAGGGVLSLGPHRRPAPLRRRPSMSTQPPDPYRVALEALDRIAGMGSIEAANLAPAVARDAVRDSLAALAATDGLSDAECRRLAARHARTTCAWIASRDRAARAILDPRD